jgi:GTP-binding protein
MSQYPSADFLTSAAHSSQFPADSGREVAFAGRSNSGKSSAINAVLGRKSLARASKTPGRTRLLNFFSVVDGGRIVDLPGYGFAAASAAERATWEPMTAALVNRQCLVGLFLIVDSRRGLLEGDFGLIDWAAGLPIHILLSKSDKLSRNEGTAVRTAAAALLGGRGEVQLFSAHAGTGLVQARAVLDGWLKK